MTYFVTGNFYPKIMIQSCLEKSTAHGLGYIGSSSSKSSKIMWLLLTLLMLSCFTFHTYLLYSQLLEENVLVSNFPDSTPFIQPDIVFCSERFFARDYINNPPDDEYEFMHNVSQEIKKFDKLYSKNKDKSFRLIWDSLSSYKLYRAFFQRKHQLFLSIKCNLKGVRLSDLTVEANFQHFACYRLKASSCNLNSPLDNLIVKFYTHIYGTNITYSKLNVTIDSTPIDAYLYVQKEQVHEMEDGIHVYLVQANEGINDETAKITASVNSHTSIKVKSVEFNRYSTKKNKCNEKIQYSFIYNLLEEDTQANPLNVTYDSMCKEISFQNIVYQKTNCVLKGFPIPLSIPPNYTFCGNIYGRLSRINFQNVWNQPGLKRDVIDNCKLNLTCKSISYVTSVNYNHWPRTSTLRELFRRDITVKLKESRMRNLTSPGLSEALDDFRKNSSNINAWKRNFVKISISPGEFQSTVIVESAAYSYKNFFSDVGGIMGFYLGASLLTLFELLRLMQCTARTIIMTSKEGEQQEEHCLNENT